MKSIPGSSPAWSPRGSDDDDDQGMPWKTKRIPGGIKTDKPYGFGEGHMTAKPGKHNEKRGSQDLGKITEGELFGGKGQTLE